LFNIFTHSCRFVIFTPNRLNEEEEKFVLFLLFFASIFIFQNKNTATKQNLKKKTYQK